MRALRFLMTAILALGVLPLAAGSASAAPPGNDEPAGAIALKPGDRVEQDTSEATTNAEDAALNEDCGAPFTNASVWYKYSPQVNRSVVLDMASSDYSGGFLVFEGTPTVESLVACGPNVVGLSVRAGRTYNIMVVSDTEVNGGDLVLALKRAPAPPRVHIRLAKRGKVYRGGAARIRGTYFCKAASDATLYGSLFQRAGRLKIRADFGKEVRCNGRRHRWSARAVSDFATFARGRARARVTIDACGMFDCRADSAKRRVRLVRATGGPSRRLLLQLPNARTQSPRALVESQKDWWSR